MIFLWLWKSIWTGKSALLFISKFPLCSILHAILSMIDHEGMLATNFGTMIQLSLIKSCRDSEDGISMIFKDMMSESWYYFRNGWSCNSIFTKRQEKQASKMLWDVVLCVCWFEKSLWDSVQETSVVGEGHWLRSLIAPNLLVTVVNEDLLLRDDGMK